MSSFERMEYPADPERCQANRGLQGQCTNKAFRETDGSIKSKYCAAHGGNRAGQIAAKRELAMYKANHYAQSVREIQGNPDLLSLNQEVALLKAMIQDKLNLIKDEHSASLYSGGLSDLIMKAEKLVSSCHRLNDKLKLSLSAEQAMAFVEVIINILSKRIQDANLLDQIQSEIAEAGRNPGVQRLESHV